MVATWSNVVVIQPQQSQHSPFQFKDVTESFVLAQLRGLKTTYCTFGITKFQLRKRIILSN